jgi:hypothetical protein
MVKVVLKHIMLAFGKILSFFFDRHENRSERALAEWESHFHKTGRENRALYWMGADGKLYYSIPSPDRSVEWVNAEKDGTGA